MEKNKEQEMSTEKRPFSRKYYEMMRKNRRLLGEVHKGAKKSPWEWSYGLDYLVQFIRFMSDYYTLGENVWAMEDKDADPVHKKRALTRLESINKTLEYYDNWQYGDEKFLKFVYHEVDGKEKCDIEYLYGPRNNRLKAMRITYKKMFKFQKKNKKLFYKMLYKYLESWWD